MKKRVIIFFLVLIITLIFKFISEVIATTCESASCSACDSCCPRCCDSRDNDFRVTQLPYRYTSPTGACRDSMSGVTIRELPFEVDGEPYSSIPVTVPHNYCVERCVPGPTSGCEYELIWWQEEKENTQINTDEKPTD